MSTDKQMMQQRGSVMAEYVAVITGFLAFVTMLPLILSLIREYYSEFSWALVLPF